MPVFVGKTAALLSETKAYTQPPEKIFQARCGLLITPTGPMPTFPCSLWLHAALTFFVSSRRPPGVLPV